MEHRRIETVDVVEKPIPQNIYRYKLSDSVIELINNFAKIHQYDDREDFKEAWETWLEDNNEMICEEKTRLSQLGYDGDVEQKMFKSARYYFRNKSTFKQEPKKRREYINVPSELLQAMDNHIREKIYDETYKPKTGFMEFCSVNEEMLRDVVKQIFENGIDDSELIEQKIKKTYKNRYFKITNK
jgi:hypothetical protein